MKYRNFGRLDWEVSALGFGAMRLPIVDNDVANIDAPEAIRMIRYAIDKGVSYLDTAYLYHRRNAECLVGKALRNGYRSKIKLATKMPTWLIKSQEDMDKYLDEQLGKLQIRQIDFYLLHGLNSERWRELAQLNVLKWLEKKQDEGKIVHIGFSFHDEYAVFKKIIEDYTGWTLCQIQYNYVDSEYQAGTQGLRYAASKGLAVVIMEPIAGGRLAMKQPSEIEAIWNRADTRRTAADWALQWVWNHPEVSVALSGMSTMEQVRQNVESADHSGSNTLTGKELQLIDQVTAKYKEFGFIACTSCRYCMPCPEGVNIPEIISYYNEYFKRDRDDEVKKKYWEHVTPESQAKRCKRCAKCEELCPQKLAIRDVISRATWIFEE